MIILDDFIRNEYLLTTFSDNKYWKKLENEPEGTRYTNVNHIPYKAVNQLICEIKNTFWTNKNWEALEYWVNITYKYAELDWHVDKNERLAEEEDKIICPQIGAVWYGHPDVRTVRGGYLEIQNDNGDLERIRPVYNRIVVFDVSQEHRVAPIHNGTRFGFQVNLW